MSASPSSPPDVTTLLQRVGEGDADAKDSLYRRVYDDMHRIARHRLYEAGDMTLLDSPALVSEAYLKLLGHEQDLAGNRKVFFAYAAKVMRNIILDYVKERYAQKRGAGERDLTLLTQMAGGSEPPRPFEDLNDALVRLERIDPRAATVVELRYFAGLSLDEIAEHLKIGSATVTRDWDKARGFLVHALSS